MQKGARQRSILVTIVLWLVMLANLIMAIGFIMIMHSTTKTGDTLGLGLCSMFAFANILGAILLLRWNKSGLGLIAISAILFSIVYIFILHIGTYSFLPIVAFISSNCCAVIFLWLILQIRKNGKSAWSQLDKGWDYKHCRHIYQIFTVGELILFILTLIVFGSNQSKQTNTEPTPVLEDTVVIYRQAPIEKQETNINLAADSKESADSSRIKPVKEKITKEIDSAKVPSLKDAAKYLDTHNIWLESEMSQYPDLRNLNKELYRSLETGRFHVPTKISTASKKLKRIEMYFKELEMVCQKEGINPQEISRFLHLKINPSRIRPDEILMRLKKAIARTKMSREKSKNKTKYDNTMDSIQIDEKRRRLQRINKINSSLKI